MLRAQRRDAVLSRLHRIWTSLLTTRCGTARTLFSPWLLRSALALAGRAIHPGRDRATLAYGSIGPRLLVSGRRTSGRILASRLLWKRLLCSSSERGR